MIRIRLQRKGRKKRPIYHLVVADSRSPRDGRIIEQVGRYDNVTEKKEVVLNEDRILYWLETGAQPSDTVRKILRNEGLLYKRHLMMWGKSEEEIEVALAEWRSYRESKEEASTSRKDKYKSVLAAEEKEFKNLVQKKSKEAAKELEADATAEEVTEEAVVEESPAPEEKVEETTSEELVQEEAVEETTDEAPAEEEVAETEGVEEEAPEVEAATDETSEEEPAVEETEAEEESPAPEASETEAEAAVETAEEVAEETPVEDVVEETKDEAPAEEEKAEEPAASSTETSDAMSAKGAIDHIKNNDLAALKGFVTNAESRKTVLAAWEKKQSEG